MQKIKNQQAQRRNSVQARVAAQRKIAKQSNALRQCEIFSNRLKASARLNSGEGEGEDEATNRQVKFH